MAFSKGIMGAVVTATALLASSEATAAMKALSRANCLLAVNESITYDRPLFRRLQGSAASTHHAQGELRPRHVVGAANNGTFWWRFRAYDYSHSERITVKGYHTWIFQGAVNTRHTYAVNCSLTEW